jgi:hypothetical protein
MSFQTASEPLKQLEYSGRSTTQKQIEDLHPAITDSERRILLNLVADESEATHFRKGAEAIVASSGGESQLAIATRLSLSLVWLTALFRHWKHSHPKIPDRENVIRRLCVFEPGRTTMTAKDRLSEFVCLDGTNVKIDPSPNYLGPCFSIDSPSNLSKPVCFPSQAQGFWWGKGPCRTQALFLCEHRWYLWFWSSDGPIHRELTPAQAECWLRGNEYDRPPELRGIPLGRIEEGGNRLDPEWKPSDPVGTSTPGHAVSGCHTAAETSRLETAGQSAAPAAHAAKKVKRSTERGEGRAKLIAALTKHHQYADDGCLNPEPIGNNALAKAAGVAPSTASSFFEAQFRGHTKYSTLCQDTSKLAAALKLLNGEYSPHLLYGRRPADEDYRHDE